MKRTLSLLLALVLIASLCTVVTTASAGSGKRYYVKTDNGGTLNLRTEPRTNAQVLQKIPYGDEFWVFEKVGNGWAYGHWGGEFGYVMTRYLSKKQPGPRPTPKPKPKPTAKPTAKPNNKAAEQQANLNRELTSETEEAEPFYVAIRPQRASGWVDFRVGPDSSTTRITRYPEGQELLVMAETTNWYRAKDVETGQVGYIYKDYTTVVIPEEIIEEDTANGKEKLGSLNVNGDFNLTCKMPEGYKLQVVNKRGTSIVASLQSEDMTRPQLYLSVAFDEAYSEVERMNDLSDEDLAVLEDSYRNQNDVEISYSETGFGTKLLVARETGADTDFVDILTIYKGYLVEFNMNPNPSSANQTLTDEQVQMCIDFLTNVDFVPAEQPQA